MNTIKEIKLGLTCCKNKTCITCPYLDVSHVSKSNCTTLLAGDALVIVNTFPDALDAPKDTCLSENELMEMLQVCATDNTDGTYNASSVQFLASSVLNYISALREGIKRSNNE